MKLGSYMPRSYDKSIQIQCSVEYVVEECNQQLVIQNMIDEMF